MYIKAILALFIVIGVIVIIYWIIKYFARKFFPRLLPNLHNVADSSMSIKEVLHIDATNKIIIVQIYECHYVILLNKSNQLLIDKINSKHFISAKQDEKN